MNQAEAKSPLEGLRILVVEDEHFIAIEIESILEHLRCRVVGPAPRLNRAISVVDETELDGALLDINLNGEYVYPLAARLRERGVPFIFATGYETPDIPTEFRDTPRLQKPFSGDELQRLMKRVFVEE